VTAPGRWPQDLLWFRQYLECVSCRDAVEYPPNGAGMGAQSTPWVERVLRRLGRPWRQDAPRPLGLPPLADDRRAETPAGATAPSPTASLGQSAPGEGHTRCGEHLVRPAERRLLTQRTPPASQREPCGPQRSRTSTAVRQVKAPYQCCE